MVFNSVIFLTLFIIFSFLYHISNRYFKLLLLLLFNVYFYIMAMGERFYILFITAIFVYLGGIIIERIRYKTISNINQIHNLNDNSNNDSKGNLNKFSKNTYKVISKNAYKVISKITLLIFLISIISLLLYFKYYNFVIENISFLIKLSKKSLIVPVGISFYTLQCISYLVDIYRGDIKSEKNLIVFLDYLCFFGTILSGPITRTSDFIPSLKSEYKFSLENTYIGMTYVLFGLFKKIMIADRLSPFVDSVFGNPYDYSLWPTAFAAFFYAIQLYADFSGYSSMAVGFSKILNIDIINNFEYPYFSKSVKEFWKRWHISLSSFLRDYIYIPLGGGRVGSFRRFLNSMIVFLVSGIWHGANFTFIFWGFLHGLYINLENILYKNISFLNKDTKAIKLIRTVITFILVDVAWVFFRADNIRSAFHIIKSSFIYDVGTKTSVLSIVNINQFIFMILLIAFLSLYEYLFFKGHESFKPISYSVNIIMIILLVLLGTVSKGQFIYFKF